MPFCPKEHCLLLVFRMRDEIKLLKRSFLFFTSIHKFTPSLLPALIAVRDCRRLRLSGFSVFPYLKTSSIVTLPEVHVAGSPVFHGRTENVSLLSTVFFFFYSFLSKKKNSRSALGSLHMEISRQRFLFFFLFLSGKDREGRGKVGSARPVRSRFVRVPRARACIWITPSRLPSNRRPPISFRNDVSMHGEPVTRRFPKNCCIHACQIAVRARARAMPDAINRSDRIIRGCTRRDVQRRIVFYARDRK